MVKVHDNGIIMVKCQRCDIHAGGSDGYVVSEGGARWAEYEPALPAVVGYWCKGMLCPKCAREWARIVKGFWLIVTTKPEGHGEPAQGGAGDDSPPGKGKGAMEKPAASGGPLTASEAHKVVKKHVDDEIKRTGHGPLIGGSGEGVE